MIKIGLRKNGIGICLFNLFEISIFTVTYEESTHICLDAFIWKLGFSQQLTLGEINLCHAVREVKKT